MLTVQDRIAHLWTLAPDAGAIEFDHRWLSWGDLRQRVQQVENALAEAGVAEGAPVGICLRNQPMFVAAILALLGQRRCLVSLNAFAPAANRQQELAQLKLPAVLAAAADWEDTALLAAQRAAGGAAVALGRMEGAEVLAPWGGALLDSDAALEILTSGTTGTPKRIKLRGGTLDDALTDGIARPEDKQALARLKTSPTIVNGPLLHVSGLFGMLVAFAEARPIVLLQRFDVAQWADAVKRFRIKMTSLPPTPMRMVLDAGVPRADLASLIAVRAGTAPLPAETQREFEERYGIPVLVQYGATEWMGGIAGWTLEEHRTFAAAKRGAVGRVRGDVQVRIVDPATGVELPTGERGLLEVRAPRRLGAAGWSRTTDIASLDADGFLYVHGRADDTIIRGGFKVNVAQVAGVLMQHPAVKEAAVVALADARLGQVPAAALELRPDAPAPSEAELRDFARAHLTAYQVPVAFRIVPTLPRTASLKVSRPAVQALFADQAAPG